MTEPERYSIALGPTPQAEHDLLDCLLRIDRQQPLDPCTDPVPALLVSAGLVEDFEGRLALTAAGILRSQALQHRVASDNAAAAVREKRRGRDI